MEHPEAHRRGEEGTLGSLATGVKEKAQDLASTVTSRAGEAWDTTRHTAQQAASRVAGTAEGAWEETTAFMRRYPVVTLCVGIGIGCLLAQFFRNQETRGHWQSQP
jgi:ElaB/YqjD/DUF883 family membrane-anchored ribosome-binding protein